MWIPALWWKAYGPVIGEVKGISTPSISATMRVERGKAVEPVAVEQAGSTVSSRATRPASGTMPLRSPMPRMVVSMWVAPASSAASALATAQPVSLWAWNSMSQLTAARSAPTSAVTCGGRGDAHGVGDADAVHAERGHGRVDAQHVGRVGAEAVLAAEAHLDPGGAHQLDAAAGHVDDLVEVQPVRVGAQPRRGAEQEVDTADAAVDGQADVVGDAARVGEDGGAQPEAGEVAAGALRLR